MERSANMTSHGKYLARIDKVAEIASESSLDALGKFVDAKDAWSFMRDSFSDDEGIMDKLPDEMPFAFPEYYAKHCQILRERRANA